MRAVACFPRQARLALLDPVHRGATFPMSKRLERVLLGFDEVQRTLDEVVGDLVRIETSYLDRHHRSFEEVPLSLRLAESQQFVLAASYPHGYDARAAQALQELATRGPAAGIHLIIHIDLETADGAALCDSITELGATVIDLGGTPVELEGADGDLVPDPAPSGSVLEVVFQRIAASPRRDAAVAWDDVQDITPQEWWEDSAEEVFAAPIGRAAADQAYDLWFGTDPELARTCAHGIVIAGNAEERHNLFDDLLAGLAIRYSPSELRLYLVEGESSAFAPWARAPQAEVVALRPSPDQARQVLHELRLEADRRITELGRRGVDRWSARPALNPMSSSARILAIIDDYEQLFVDDSEEAATADLARLLELADRAGVHLLLGGSRFDGAGPLHRTRLFEQFDLRVAMQLAGGDSLGRDEFGINGVRLVHRVCDRPRRAVANTMRGHDDGNIAVQVASLPAARRDELIASLAHSAHERGIATGSNYVLNGATQPQLVDNPHLTRLVDRGELRSPEALREFARTSPLNGGLGIDDWIDEERPRLFFLGQSEQLYGQAHLVLRRRPTENVLIVMRERSCAPGRSPGC